MMIEKNLILTDLQEQLKVANSPEVKVMLQNIIADVLIGKYNVRIWE